VYNSAAEIKKRYDAGLNQYGQLYELVNYPAFFVLDKDKNFIDQKD